MSEWAAAFAAALVWVHARIDDHVNLFCGFFMTHVGSFLPPRDGQFHVIVFLISVAQEEKLFLVVGGARISLFLNLEELLEMLCLLPFLFLLFPVFFLFFQCVQLHLFGVVT